MSSEITIPALAAISPPALLQHALTSGASIEALEKLMALEERWRANEAKRAFNRAMAAVRSDLPVIVKSQKVDFTTNRGRTHYKYEDLHDVTEALTPVMAKHGLAFRWRTEKGEPVSVTCIVSHQDGHSEETSLSAPRDESGNKNAIQSLGSAITYLQRYTLKAALGVAASSDDDGQSSSQRKHPEPAQEQHATPPAPVSREPNREKLRERMLANLTQFDQAQLAHYAESKGYIAQGRAITEWNLANVPNTREGLDLLVRDIEVFIMANYPVTTSDLDELPAEIADVIFHIPPKGVKKRDYKSQTIGQMYAQRHDEDVANRLFGTLENFKADGWTKDDGTKMPPSAEDIALRNGLDKLQNFLDEKEQGSFKELIP